MSTTQTFLPQHHRSQPLPLFANWTGKNLIQKTQEYTANPDVVLKENEN